MTCAASTTRRTKRAGYSLVEVMVVAGLMGLMVMMVSAVWKEMGRTSVDTIARCRVTEEASLAMEALTRELGGYLNGSVLGDSSSGKMVGRLIIDHSQLLLCFEGEPSNGEPDWTLPDHVISYELEGDQLVRVNRATGASTVLARHVQSLQLADRGDGININVSFAYRDHTRNYSIVTRDP